MSYNTPYVIAAISVFTALVLLQVRTTPVSMAVVANMSSIRNLPWLSIHRQKRVTVEFRLFPFPFHCNINTSSAGATEAGQDYWRFDSNCKCLAANKTCLTPFVSPTHFTGVELLVVAVRLSPLAVLRSHDSNCTASFSESVTV